MFRGFLLINLASTLFMTGLIWFVQIVHYPLFAKTGTSNFALYAKDHSRLTSWVVGPVMLIEAASAAALPLLASSSVILWAGLALVVAIWLSTAIIQYTMMRVCRMVSMRASTAAWLPVIGYERLPGARVAGSRCCWSGEPSRSED